MDEISNELKKLARSDHHSKSYVPLIAEKNKLCLTYQRNSFSFDRIFLKLTDTADMAEIADRNWPDRIINLRVTSSRLLKTPLFDIGTRITHSVLMGSS